MSARGQAMPAQAAPLPGWLKLVIALLVLVGSCWILVILGALPYLPTERRAMLAMLREPYAPPKARNAVVDAYLVSRAIEVDDWPTYVAMPEQQAVGRLLALPAIEDPAKGFPGCGARDVDCLAQVGRDPDTARRLRDSTRAHLSRIERLQREPAGAAAVGAWNLDASLPPMNGLHATVRLDAAVRFVDGEHGEAMRRVCRHALWWRGLRRRTDMLIVDLIGAAYLSGAASGYAEMLAASPSDQVPPPECAQAFALLADEELDLCRVVRSEFRMADNSMRQLMATADTDIGWGNRLARALSYRHDATMAMVAPGYAEYCSTTQRERVARRQEATPLLAGECGPVDWPFNAIGCSLGAVASDFTPYYHRLLDLDGRLRAVASAQWLRDQRAGESGFAFADRPDSMHDPRIHLEGDACARFLSYDARVTRPGEPTWRIPVHAPEACRRDVPTP